MHRAGLRARVAAIGRRELTLRQSQWFIPGLIAMALILGLVIAGAQGGGAPGRSIAPQSVFDVASSEGASIEGMTEYAAYDPSVHNTGQTIGPDYTQGELASEAVGREAVQLTAQGQFIEFTLTAPANAIDVHYALAQGASGNLSVYIDGTKIQQELALTAGFSYLSTPGIAGSTTHHFFNDARMLLGQRMPRGTKVRLQVDAGDSAAPYTIDVADFFLVPDQAQQPAGSLSVTDEGADPTGKADSSAAFAKAIASAGGKVVWVPPGSYQVGTPLQVPSGTIQGAGAWSTFIEANKLIDNPTSTVPGPVNLSGFSIVGSTVGRHDDSTQNAINGSLGTGSTVDGLWIQNTNVGFWLQGASSGLTIRNCVIFDTSADGINLNGSAVGATVTNNFLRNNGDDGLAVWSLYSAVTKTTFSYNTVVQPNLANGIALYGGTDSTVTNNVVADTNPLGSGIDVSNQQFIAGSGFSPLDGTTTVSNNTLIRSGADNPNWKHPMAAIRIDANDYPITHPINLVNTTIMDSPRSAIQFVSGNGKGLGISGVTIDGADIQGVGTVVFQAETSGSASVQNLVASDVGVQGTYDSAFPGNTAGAFDFKQGTGNSGWSVDPVLTEFPTAVAPTAVPTIGSGGPPPTGDSSAASSAAPSTVGTDPASATPPGLPSSASGPTAASEQGGDLAYRKPTQASGYTQTYVSANAVDADPNSYWESADNSFPQWFQVDLGTSTSLGRVDMAVPPAAAWGLRTQVITVLGSDDGSSFATVVGTTPYTFDPATGNKVSVPVPPGKSARYLRLVFTANTGWPAGQLSQLQVFGPSGSSVWKPADGPGSGNLALGMPAQASSATQDLRPANAVSGSQTSYWESTGNALPQWWQVDLGRDQDVGRVVLELPDTPQWWSRTQTLSVLGLTDGSMTFTTLAGPAAYTFDTASGNQVTISFPRARIRTIRLEFTANSGWPAAQLSGFQAYAS